MSGIGGFLEDFTGVDFGSVIDSIGTITGAGGNTSSGFDWLDGNFLSAGVNALGGLTTGLLSNSIASDKLEAEQQRADKDRLLQLQLEALKAKFAGGGGSGPFTGLTDAQKAQIIQNQTDTKIGALNNLVTGLQNAYLSRTR